jgi:hypothetical protein
MCVTLHWIDDAWQIQKRIMGLFHLEGRHTGHRLAEAFTEVLVKWFVEKKIFALTLDNASNNLVAVTAIIDDLKLNGNGSLVCDGIFFHIRCACHILNLVARDGMAVISKTLDKVKALVLTVKGSPLQWEERMKCATECGLDTSKGIIQLDVSTRWNSSYLMLRDAKDVCDCEYKDVRYSDLSSWLSTVSVEFPAVLVRFHAAAYPDSVSEPDPVSAKKYRNGNRNGVFRPFSSVFISTQITL